MNYQIPEPLKKYGAQVFTYLLVLLISVAVVRFGLEDSVTVVVPDFPQPPIEVLFPSPVAAPEPPPETAVTYGYQTLVHGDGPDKLVVESGGEIEVKSGGILDLQTGSLNTFAGTIDFSGATVTNLATSGATTSTNLIVLGTSDLQGNISNSTGAITVADNALIDGAADAVQLTVQGYTTNTNYLFVVEQSDGTDVWRTNVSGQSSSANGAVSFVDDVIVDGAEDTDQLTVQGYTTQTNDLQVWEQYDGTDVATMTNAGALDVASTINYGTDSLYPLGYASASQQVECGVTATFTDTVAVTASALTTATYVTAVQITDPAATASILTVDAPAANVFNIDSWESDFSVGTTGITVYWCAIGNQ